MICKMTGEIIQAPAATLQMRGKRENEKKKGTLSPTALSKVRLRII